VTVANRDHYQLLTTAGELSAEPSGALWYQTTDHAGMPVTGDWVAARAVDSSYAIVEAVLPRKTVFSRRAAGRREEEQPVASNIDVVFLVCGLDADFNLRRLERYMTLATEAYLCTDIADRVAETATVVRGAPIITASTKRADGIDGIRSWMAYGRTVALLGSSGVGKSAIVNCLLGEDRQWIGEVRESDNRGRHTTTRRELIPLADGGAVIDTPGMRELQLWAGQESVDEVFREIAEIAFTCRFRNCSHSGETGCAVADSVARGVISEERWQSYRKLRAEVRRHEEMTDPLAAAERKKKLKTLHRGARSFYRQRDR
jgi:ribosome biogenesis GTPase